ncbi:hypothetical protein [Streptomyces sp. NPDC093089]|uniref:hypothetical protein n=1 Tax=Streptomyces sp. NPDC093089 TaxID=3366024 RepID=UPI00380C127A
MDIKTTEKTEKTAEKASPAEAEEAAAETAGTVAEAVDAPAAETAEGVRDASDGDPKAAPSGAADEDGLDDELDDEADDELDDETVGAETAGGTGTGAAAVVSAALGAVALTGTWTGKVVSERETLIGQITTSQSGSPAQQISEIYGDAWHSTALVNGVFALLALIVALVVLTLPRRAGWVRAVAVAGAVLGGLGLLLSIGTYFDLFLTLPTAGS